VLKRFDGGRVLATDCGLQAAGRFLESGVWSLLFLGGGRDPGGTQFRGG